MLDAEYLKAQIKVTMDLSEAEEALRSFALENSLSFKHLQQAISEYEKMTKLVAKELVRVEKERVAEQKRLAQQEIALEDEVEAAKKQRIRDSIKDSKEIEAAKKAQIRNDIADAKERIRLDNEVERNMRIVGRMKVKALKEEADNERAALLQQSKDYEKLHNEQLAELRAHYRNRQRIIIQGIKDELENRRQADIAYARDMEILERDRANRGMMKGSTALRIGAGAAAATGNYNVAGAAYALANVAETMGTKIPIAAAAGTAGILALGGAYAYAVAQGEKFDVALHDTATLLDGAAGNAQVFHERMRQMGEDAIAVSNIYGTDVIDVLKSFKTALSSGIEADQLKSFMTTASTLSTALGVELDKSVDILTTFKDAYGLQIAELSAVSSQLWTTVDIGKISVEGLSKNLGRLVPVASQAGISIKDLDAGMATLSRVMNNSQATTAFTNFIRSMVNPTEKARKELERLGIAYGDVAFRGREFADVVREIRDKVGSDSAVLGKIMGDEFGVRGAAAFTQLLPLLEEARSGMNKLGQDTIAAAVKMDTFTAKVNKDLTALKNSIIGLGKPGLLNELYDSFIGEPQQIAAIHKLRVAMEKAKNPNFKEFTETPNPAPLMPAVVKPIEFPEETDATARKKFLDGYAKAMAEISKADSEYIEKSSREEANARITAAKEYYAYQYFNETMLSKHIEELEKQRRAKVADLEHLQRPPGATGAEDPALKDEDARRAKLVMFRIRDEQKEVYAEMKVNADNAAKAIVEKLEFYKSSHSGELLDILGKMEALSAFIKTNKNAALVGMATEGLSQVRKLYEEKYAAYVKDYQAYEKSLHDKADLDKKALRYYENTILQQQTRLEVERIEKLAKLETKRADDVAKFKERRALLEHNYKAQLDNIKDDDTKRRYKDKYRSEDSGRPTGTENWRKLKNSLDLLKDEMEAALKGGDTEKFQMLKERAESTYDRYRVARVADGAGDKQFQYGGVNSFEAMFGDLIAKNNDLITKNLTDKAKEKYQIESNTITREAAKAEAEYQKAVKEAAIKGNEAQISADETLKNILSVLTNNQTAAKPKEGGTPKTPTTGPTPTSGQGSGVNPDDLDDALWDPDARKDFTQDNGGANDYKPVPDGKFSIPGMPNPGEPSPFLSNNSTRSLTPRTLQPKASAPSNSFGGPNITVNATDPSFANRLGDVIRSAVDTYYKANSIQGSTNNMDVRANNVYAPNYASPKAINSSANPSGRRF